jgi:NAD-dependent DNA ligase
MSVTFIYFNIRQNVSAYTVKSLSEKGDYSYGFCIAANHLRTFRTNRIIERLEDDSQCAERLAYWQKNQDKIPKEFIGPVIHFTGFKAADKARLTALATKNRMQVCTSATDYMDFLCCGYNASEKKIEKAEKNGAMIVTEDEFLALVKNTLANVIP